MARHRGRPPPFPANRPTWPAQPYSSNEEHRTARIAAGWLKDLGFEVIEGIATTGVAGVLRNGDGPVVLGMAEDKRFELLRGCPQHAFQACALGH